MKANKIEWPLIKQLSDVPVKGKEGGGGYTDLIRLKLPKTHIHDPKVKILLF